MVSLSKAADVFDNLNLYVVCHSCLCTIKKNSCGHGWSRTIQIFLTPSVATSECTVQLCFHLCMFTTRTAGSTNVFFILTLTNSYAFVDTQVALDYAMYGDWSSRYLITPLTLTNVMVIQVEFNRKLLTGKSDFQVKCLCMGGSEPHNVLHWGWELVLTHQLPPGMIPKISKTTLSLLYV